MAAGGGNVTIDQVTSVVTRSKIFTKKIFLTAQQSVATVSRKMLGTTLRPCTEDAEARCLVSGTPIASLREASSGGRHHLE
jgi:hypothetical protein